MRIRRLDLLAFGPFTGQSLDLHAGDFGLHLIHGPNEAGKSSALRALRQFFFGFKTTTTDNFLHDYKSLRIGAVLDRGVGDPLHAIRRKGNKQTLRAADDVLVIDEAELTRLLGGIGEDEFTHRFGIDHDGFAAGSQDMLTGGGDVGSSLFAAAGISHLQAIVKGFEDESAALFKPSGQNPRINASKSRWKDADERQKPAQLLPADWQQHHDALVAAEARLAELNRNSADSHARKRRLERVRDALPLIGQRRDSQAKLQPLEHVPRLRENLSTERREASHRLQTANATATDAGKLIEGIERAIDGLILSESLLAHAGEIERLQKLLGAVHKATIDRRRLLDELESCRREAQRRLTELGRGPAAANEAQEADAADAADDKILRLTPGQRAGIQELGGKRDVLLEKLQAAEQRRDELTRQQADSQQQLDRLPPPRDGQPLQTAIKAARREGDLDGQLDKVKQQTKRLESQAAREMKLLAGWSGSLEQLAAAAPPADETIDRFEQEFSETDDALKSLHREQKQFAQERLAKAGELSDVGVFRDVPTEADLIAARQSRADGWNLLRRAILGEPPDPPTTGEFISRFPPADDLAQALWAAIVRCDEIADRMRRESEQVARKANLQSDVARLELLLAKLREELSAAEIRRGELAERWRAAWSPLSLDPLSPREMRAWRSRFADLLKQADAIRDQQVEAARLAERIATHRAKLVEQQVLLVAGDGRVAETLAELLESCDAVWQRCDADRDERQTVQRELSKAAAERPRAEADARAAKEALAAWRVEWAKAVEAIHLTVDATPTEARETVAAITELLDTLTEAEKLERRIAGIDADRSAFAAGVERLVQAAAIDLADRPAEEAADELQRRLAESQKSQARQAELQKQLARERKRQTDAEHEEKQAFLQLAALCQEAGCQSPEELLALEPRAAERREIDRKLEQLDGQLRLLAAGQTLDEFVTQAGCEDADKLPEAIRSLGDDLENLETEKRSLSETVGRERELLQQMDGSGVAAEAEEEAQALLAQMHTDVERFVRLRLSAAVLQRAIQRYREKNQGPVLQRAGELFAKLTDGSFSGLRDDYNESGKPVLLGVRGDRTTALTVDAMSDGTRDQLYLALRLASLEQFLDQHEPIPLIVDDILIQFDDTRAVAAMKVLATFSSRTQILFFTHHQHLIDLAQQHLSPPQLFVHRLGGG